MDFYLIIIFLNEYLVYLGVCFVISMLRYLECYQSYSRRSEDLLQAFHMDFHFYTQSIKILGLLGNSTRLSIVCKLVTIGSLSVSDLSKQTKITEDLIVQHMRKLISGDIVISERIGKRLYFKIKDNKTIEIIKVLGLLS